MSNDDTQQYLEELKEIQSYLNKMDFDSKIIEKEPLPIDVLLTALPVDFKERNRYINFSFVPLADDDLEFINLLQFYTTLPTGLIEEHRPLVENLVQLLNIRTAVGHFGIQQDGEIYMRYIFSTHKSQGINEAQFVETLYLYIMQLDMYGELIEKTANGDMTFEQIKLFLNES